MGGLGLRSMLSQNQALLARLGWKILRDEDLLWIKALRKKYLKKVIC
jgi:hypothetical protein